MTRVLATLQQESSVTFEVTTLKELSKSDVSRIHALERELYLGDIQQYTKSINKTYARLMEGYVTSTDKSAFRQETIIGLVRDNKTIIGFVAATVRDKFGAINSVFVDVKFQGKGYGRSLVTSVLEDKLCKSVVVWKLNVSVGNKSAKKLYQSLGFDVVQEAMVMTV